MPGRATIRCRQSERLRRGVRVLTRSGDYWVFTDSVFRMKVRTTAPSAVVLLDLELDMSVDPDDSTRLLIDIAASDTATLPPGDHQYDLFVDDVPVLEGPFLVTAGVSR